MSADGLGGALALATLQPVQTLVYDAGRADNEYSHMADFPKMVMDTAVLSASIATPEPGIPAALSTTL